MIARSSIVVTAVALPFFSGWKGMTMQAYSSHALSFWGIAPAYCQLHLLAGAPTGNLYTAKFAAALFREKIV